MPEIINTMIRIWQLQIAIFVNKLIFYAQRLPLIGRMITDRAYAAAQAKRRAGVAAVVLILMGGLAESFLYFGVLLALPIALWTDNSTADERLALFMHMYFCMSVLLAGVSSAKVLESSKMKYTIVRLMRVAPTRYMRAVLVNRYATLLVYQWIAMMVTASTLGISAQQALLLVGAVTMWRILCELLHLRLFRYVKIILVKKTGLVSLVMLITLAAAYLPFTGLIDVSLFGAAVLGQPLLLVLLLLSGLAAGYILLRRTNYTDAVRAVTSFDDPLLNMERMLMDLQQKSVQTDRTDNSGVLPAQDKRGYAYLHSVFVKRHRGLVAAPFHKRLVIISVIGVLLALSALFYTEHLNVTQLERYVSFIILAMFQLTMGNQLCRALFRHCDLPLMRYSFYRKDALQHFRLRLRWLLGRNILIGGSLAAVLSVFILIVAEGRFHPILLPIWLLTLALAVIFTVHHLLLYYLLQPYTTDMTTGNPWFTLLNSLGSIGFLAAFLLRPAPWILALTVASLTVVYFISAFPLVSRYSCSRFSLK
ncbi:hypothetical protein [Paenibacillus sp. FSL R7-0333]|uniref:hypothetical protein n=1 Tax=Paenibacillus sp. FSL R7-0333 TaxID=1926587 RepID=UPI00096D4A61|nr:hypothetical protein BK146_03480 [Paenibacillus sp. FSL R7-0333]